VRIVRVFQTGGNPHSARNLRAASSSDASQLGFTLAEIENFLRLRTRRWCRVTRELAARKLQIVEGRIRQLRELRKALAHLIADCDVNRVDSNCPVIERLALQSHRID